MSTIERAKELITLGEAHQQKLGTEFGPIAEKVKAATDTQIAASEALAKAQMDKDAADKALNDAQAVLNKANADQTALTEALVQADSAVTQFESAARLLTNRTPVDDALGNDLQALAVKGVGASKAGLISIGALPPPIAPVPPSETPAPAADPAAPTG